MDKIEGWEEEKLVGSSFAACMWIYTKAVLCDGQENTQDYLRQGLYPSVCDDALEDHEWVSELTISIQETEVLVALNHDIEVPCIVQWRMLWFTSPTSLNRIFSFNGRNTTKLVTCQLKLRSLCPLADSTRRECAC